MNTMRPLFLGVCMAVGALALTGCATPPSAYIDHGFPVVAPEQLEHQGSPWRLQVVTRRYLGDRVHDDITPWVHSAAMRALSASRLVEPSPTGDDGKIVVTVRELVPSSEALAKSVTRGALGGLTLGAIGFTESTQFEVSLEVTVGERTVRSEPVAFDVNVRFGSASEPPGKPSHRNLNVARSLALQDAIMWSIRSMQIGGTWPANER